MLERDGHSPIPSIGHSPVSCPYSSCVVYVFVTCDIIPSIFVVNKTQGSFKNVTVMTDA